MERDWEKQATFSLLQRSSKSHLFDCSQGGSKLSQPLMPHVRPQNKMKAKEFKQKWTAVENNLEPFDSKEIEDLKINEQSKDFLKTGLPSQAAPFLSFGHTDEANLQPANKVWSLPTKFECYKVIGSNGYGDPVCINENDNSVVYLNHDDEFEYVYMNSSVEQLAHFLLIVRDFIENINSSSGSQSTKILNSTIAEMIKIDKIAMNEGSWEDDLRSFIE